MEKGENNIVTSEMADNITGMDKWDYIVAASSGVLAASLDVLFVGELSLSNAQSWGHEKADEFVLNVAKSKRYACNDLSDAIKKLEKDYPIPADQLTDKFGGGRQHHLRDFSHHPTLMGLLFSILTQFTQKGYGTDTQGNFKIFDLPNDERIGGDFAEKVFNGTVLWAFHLISDMAGSSQNAGLGTGIPGPLLSFLKEISSIPEIKKIAGMDERDNYIFSVTLSKLFNGTLLGEHDENGRIIKDRLLRFDLRTEIGIAHNIGEQALPVIVNECIVRAFYTIRRFAVEVSDKQLHSLTDLRNLDSARFLPYNNRTMTRMITVSAGTFSVIEASTAAVKSAIKNRGFQDNFVLDLLLNVNYVGILHFGFALKNEAKYVYSDVKDSIDEEIGENKLYNVILAVREHEASRIFGNMTTCILGCASDCPPAALVAYVYKELSTSLAEYKLAIENRIRIEAESEEAVRLIREYRTEMNAAVEQYMSEHLEVFDAGFRAMDEAIIKNDVNGFIAGNTMIQEILGHEIQFQSHKEFDDLMASDAAFKL